MRGVLWLSDEWVGVDSDALSTGAAWVMCRSLSIIAIMVMAVIVRMTGSEVGCLAERSISRDEIDTGHGHVTGCRISSVSVPRSIVAAA